MSSLVWKEYVKTNLMEYRYIYDELSPESKKLLEKDKSARLYLPFKPCQVGVFDFVEPQLDFFLFLHNARYQDMEVEVFEYSKLEDFQLGMSQQPKLQELIGRDGILDLVNEIRDIITLMMKNPPLMAQYGSVHLPCGTLLFYEQKNLLLMGNRGLANEWSSFSLWRLGQIIRDMQGKRIEETVSALKRDAEAIPEEVDSKNKIIETTEKLEDQMKELHERLEAEVGGVRQLIGTSEKFLDWKAFSTDVQHLKTSHVEKEVFNTEIKRIDEKIDKGLEALNTRIEDLKAIKFWSKRTVLEIALAVWGAIVTLYAAGIIKI